MRLKLFPCKRKHATKEESDEKKRRTEADISQEQEWTLLQEDDFAEREVPMPVCEQKRSRGWFEWLFGKEEKGRETGRVELNLSEQEDQSGPVNSAIVASNADTLASKPGKCSEKLKE